MAILRLKDVIQALATVLHTASTDQIYGTRLCAPTARVASLGFISVSMMKIAMWQSARGRNRKALTRLADWSYIILAMHNPVWATASVDQLVERLSRAILVPM